MDEPIQLKFPIQGLQDGKASTGSEIEVELLGRLRASSGTGADTLWSLAVLYQKSHHLDQASACIRNFIELTKDHEKIGAAYLALGQIEETRGDFASAAAYYRQALGFEPCARDTLYFIHNNLGYSLNQLGNHRSALPHLGTALALDPSRPNAYKNLGLAYAAIGNPRQAAELFIAATQANAADSRSFAHLMALLKANPALEVDVPGLRDRVEACKAAVQAASPLQPNLRAHPAPLRSKQQRKRWQFWKGR